MKCDECGQEKQGQTYSDTCDSCVLKLMGKLWREDFQPLIESFVKQVKEGGKPE